MALSTSNTISNKNKNIKWKRLKCVRLTFFHAERKIDFEPKTIHKEIKQRKSNNRIPRSKLIIGVIKVYQFFSNNQKQYLLKATFISFKQFSNWFVKCSNRNFIEFHSIIFRMIVKDDKSGIQYYRKFDICWINRNDLIFCVRYCFLNKSVDDQTINAYLLQSYSQENFLL